MDSGVRGHGMKADSPGYLRSKYECFRKNGWSDIPHWRDFNVKLCSNATEGRTNERTNERKDENYIPLGINAAGIIMDRIVDNIKI